MFYVLRLIQLRASDLRSKHFKDVGRLVFGYQQLTSQMDSEWYGKEN
jgi:hypothetical protein